MKKLRPIFVVLLLGILIWSCEQPKSPDFQVNQQFEIPLTVNKTYQFLGADDALIDTTSEDFDNLFESNSDGLVKLVKEEEVNFGDLNSAIPEVVVPLIETVNLTVPPTTGSQTVTANGSSSVDNSAFEFRDAAHFVGLEAGALTTDITNGTDVSIDLEITFSEVQDSGGSPLVISINNISPGESISNSVDLADHQIYAGIDNEIDYEITVSTNNSTSGGDVTTEVGFESLNVSRAEGYIVPKNILLNEDHTNDLVENVDVFNDDEADVTTIDGIKQISDHLSGLTFDNPQLSTLYETNLGVNTTIYAVIGGTNSNGNTEFLKGINGSEHEVESTEIPSQLEVNGQPAEASQIIKFQIETAENPDPETGESGGNEFNATNTNSSAFFSNLPSQIRFIGVAEVNKAQEAGTIVNPVIFDPSMGVEIPFSLSADNGSYKDTVDADLGDLPGEEDDNSINEAAVTINYTNGLPLSLGLNLIMIDDEGNEVLRKSDIAVDGATIGDDGFASGSAESEQEISFSENELNELNRTRSMILDLHLNTPEQQSVNVKESDAVRFKVRIKAEITSTVN